ncbi:MAG: molybdate ABC transporter substrate-binding protein, partial [Gemmatimonadetes bacterium]|nr:molybdate ABC transporter substrate-binding protein [Gemmatimonadota bacterium]
MTFHGKRFAILAQLAILARFASLAPVLLLLLDCGRETRESVFVFAAASLTRPLRDVAALYEARRPHERVDLQFAGSHILAAQIRDGAPADLYLAAGREAVAALPEGARASDALLFAESRLAWVFRKGLETPAGVDDWLREEGGTLVIGVEHVPVGHYARAYLSRLMPEEVWSRRVVSHEADERAVWGKVMLGEADAGIVYATSRDEGHELTIVSVPDSLGPRVEYVAVLLENGRNRAGAARFLAFLTGEEGRVILAENGLELGALH